MWLAQKVVSGGQLIRNQLKLRLFGKDIASTAREYYHLKSKWTWTLSTLSFRPSIVGWTHFLLTPLAQKVVSGGQFTQNQLKPHLFVKHISNTFQGYLTSKSSWIIPRFVLTLWKSREEAFFIEGNRRPDLLSSFFFFLKKKWEEGGERLATDHYRLRGTFGDWVHQQTVPTLRRFGEKKEKREKQPHLRAR